MKITNFDGDGATGFVDSDGLYEIPFEEGSMNGRGNMLRAYCYTKSRLSGDTGATMVEYGIMVALIAVLSIVVVGLLGFNVFSAFDTAQDNIDPAQGPLQPSAANPTVN